jgi:transposase
MTTVTAVGIDIAKLKFDAAAWSAGKYKNKVFPNNAEGFAAFVSWLAQFEAPRLCLEATGSYGEALATFVFDQGFPVSVVNPAQISAFGKTELLRSKTDRGDAKLIARFCALHQPALWQPLPRSVRDLQALVRRLDHLLEMRHMEANRSLTAEPVVQASIATILSVLEAQIEATRSAIRHHIDQNPTLRQQQVLLESIPGIGPTTSAALLGLLGEITRFDTAKQVVAFTGLNPTVRESGQWRGASRLSKTGDARLRRVLYMPALVAWRYNPVINVFCERLKSRGKHGKAIACAAMRKLLHIAYGVLKSGMPFNPDIPLAR